jgi:hypothetical protein
MCVPACPRTRGRPPSSMTNSENGTLLCIHTDNLSLCADRHDIAEICEKVASMNNPVVRTFPIVYICIIGIYPIYSLSCSMNTQYRSVLFEGLPRTTRRYIFSMNTQYRSVLFEGLPHIIRM